MSIVNNSVRRNITTRNMAHQLVEELGLEVDECGLVSASKAAFLLQKLITCIDESNSLNQTFSKLLTTESLDYQNEAECAIALNKVVSEHIDITLKRNIIEDEPSTSENSNDLLMQIAQNKIHEKDNINEINTSSMNSNITNVTLISEFKQKRKSSQYH
jgi:hypothetical protein